jgi:DNA-binding MarR family transcriptional regulator
MSGAATTSRETAGLANEAWESLLTAHTRLIKELAAEEIWDDLSMREYDVLYTLSKCPAPIRLGELERHVLLSQPALSRMVDRLVRKGLVLREPDPADARGRLLSLSAAGRSAQRRIGRRHARGVTRAMTRELSRSELRDLRYLCDKLVGVSLPTQRERR